MICTAKPHEIDVLIVGAGPAGLACSLSLKKTLPSAKVCVIDKAPALGNHNLSGAVLERRALEVLLDRCAEDWRNSEEAEQVLGRKVIRDDIVFLAGPRFSINLFPILKLADRLGLQFGDAIHTGDTIVSISRLTVWLGELARRCGVEIYHEFAASEVVFGPNGIAEGIRLVAQGRDRSGREQPNYLPSEMVSAKIIVLAEGCDGLVTEKFISQAGLERQTPQLYSIGIKELIRVSENQYTEFTESRVVHAMGYPIWQPLFGPEMFGGGIMYAYGDSHIAVGMIVSLDWHECDFNPQDALSHFKGHRWVRHFINGGDVVEAGAKMIPEGGYFAIPRHPITDSIGTKNVFMIGDSAGFVNMWKIKGLHLAIESGSIAGEAAAQTLSQPDRAAAVYTDLLDRSEVISEMRSARNLRQTISKLGNLLGFTVAPLSNLLPRFSSKPDYQALQKSHYRYRGNSEFDKDTFAALAHTQHREDQPSHLLINDPTICAAQCAPKFDRPCIVFCPAGVYEEVQGSLCAANPSNCLHCKTCQRKCPFGNIRWVAPEGGGGPRYKRM